MPSRGSRRRSMIASAVAALAALVLPAGAAAQLAPGDIVIADPDANAGAGAVFKVDPLTGAASTLATGAPLVNPTDVAIDAQGNILVVDEAADPAGFAVNTGAVFRFASGAAPTPLATSPLFADPDGIAVDAQGNILVGDNNADPNALAPDTGAVFRFAPGSAPAPLAVSAQFEDPGDIAIAPDGRIIVADDGANPPGFPTGEGAIFTFKPGDAPAVLAAGPPFLGPDGVAIDARGNTLVSDDAALGSVPDTGAIFKIASGGGAIATLAASPLFNDPEHLAIESDGRILVVDDAAEPSLFRVDAATGEVTPFASSPLFAEPEGVAVVPPKCGGRFATIVGDATKNTLKGTSGADVIWGGAGKDKIRGGKGADRICGDKGKDKLFGQQGKDRLFGGKGADKLRGGKGNDRLNGGKGKDDVEE
jgi:DNA-binding beta-propeller fold protein YncE